MGSTHLLVCWVWLKTKCGALLMPDVGSTSEFHLQLLDGKLFDSKEGSEYRFIRELRKL